MARGSGSFVSPPNARLGAEALLPAITSVLAVACTRFRALFVAPAGAVTLLLGGLVAVRTCGLRPEALVTPFGIGGLIAGIIFLCLGSIAAAVRGFHDRLMVPRMKRARALSVRPFDAHQGADEPRPGGGPKVHDSAPLISYIS
ncbi:hypothetical protein EYW49_22090 [Siculibacillus lacustris]|uniref:Uncharacterized protein n=1 Tax=Siculibacillus lacustris TaxID=1549641 RepID=A0A4V2KSE7_9HYPH|nr:hypothetical protein [Siculibacillus lacustris]TBW32430.1 hypothetical protein EYW49_22090 [Siculibacillus lacustris]